MTLYIIAFFLKKSFETDSLHTDRSLDLFVVMFCKARESKALGLIKHKGKWCWWIKLSQTGSQLELLTESHPFAAAVNYDCIYALQENFIDSSES